MKDNPFEQAKWETIQVNNTDYTICNFLKSALTIITSTESEDIAKKFNILRDSNGENYIGLLPENAHKHTLNHRYKGLQIPDDGPLFKADQMEDKFDIYKYDNLIYITRSWTGELVVSLEVNFEEVGMTIKKIHDKNHNSPEYSLRFVDYIIKSHFLNCINIHPLPDNLKDVEITELAQYSFSIFGRRGWYGTFENTLSLFNDTKYVFQGKK